MWQVLGFYPIGSPTFPHTRCWTGDYFQGHQHLWRKRLPCGAGWRGWSTRLWQWKLHLNNRQCAPVQWVQPVFWPWKDEQHGWRDDDGTRSLLPVQRRGLWRLGGVWSLPGGILFHCEYHTTSGIATGMENLFPLTTTLKVWQNVICQSLIVVLHIAVKTFLKLLCF